MKPVSDTVAAGIVKGLATAAASLVSDSVSTAAVLRSSIVDIAEPRSVFASGVFSVTTAPSVEVPRGVELPQTVIQTVKEVRPEAPAFKLIFGCVRSDHAR